MLVVTAADIVLRDRVQRGTIVVEGDRIAVIEGEPRRWPDDASRIDARNHFVLPGFVDLHVHGILGHDVLDEGDPLGPIAAALTHFGVTTFCPTTVACRPQALRRVLTQVERHRSHRQADSARVHGAHLESNFINPLMKGAQPPDCIWAVPGPHTHDGDAAAEEILTLVAEHRKNVAIVTMAPEIPRGLDLVRRLADMKILVSLGHSTADFEVANAAFDAGAHHATHLFNRMLPLGHREPGLAGAALAREDVITELICDGRHVHPSVLRFAIACKGTGGVVAISDGTAGAGLPAGSCATLGGQRITVASDAAFLDDGTLAGSTLTMDGAFRTLVQRAGQSVVSAAAMCATTPARALELDDRGVIAPGMLADLVILDRDYRVTHTCIAGRLVYSRDNGAAPR